MERLTFEGNFCEIAKCSATPGGSYCEDGMCGQRRVWNRLADYEDKIPFDRLDEAAALVKARDDGRAATWPKELWAIKPNPQSHDWNDETEYHIVHYIVHTLEPETGRYFVNTDNYPGLKQRHWIKGKGLYKSRAEAEAALGGGGDE